MRGTLIALVRFYQLSISPLFPASCRFTPTCSQFMIEAIRIYGPFHGFWMGLKRLSKCHPWGSSGYDPVPHLPNKTNENCCEKP
ncbi:MAG: membrane protein insertion efficiency factor YidD [Cyclobacteriaceae bacterium]|nr:membrane protein insertion efficiency factor YidD [Cyclobacteriaceae bacterium]